MSVKNYARTYTVFFPIYKVCTRGVSLTNLFRSYLLIPICLFTFSCRIVLEKEIIDFYVYIYQIRCIMQDKFVNFFVLIGKKKKKSRIRETPTVVDFIICEVRAGRAY